MHMVMSSLLWFLHVIVPDDHPQEGHHIPQPEAVDEQRFAYCFQMR